MNDQNPNYDFLFQKENQEPTCPVQLSLTLLQGKWTARIIYALLKKDPLRFGEFKKEIPAITNTMLTATLKELESQNIVLRTQFNEIPLRVEYSITPKGQALLPVFYELGKWGIHFHEKAANPLQD